MRSQAPLPTLTCHLEVKLQPRMSRTEDVVQSYPLETPGNSARRVCVPPVMESEPEGC